MTGEPGLSLLEHVAEVRRRPGTRKPLHRSVPAEGLALSSAWVPGGSELDVDLVIESIPEGIVVSGTIVVPWQGECRRCLGEVDGIATVDIREIYEPRPVEGETWPLTGDQLDLGPLLRETVLLNLPLAPLCREDCLGPVPEAFPALPADADPALLADPAGASSDGMTGGDEAGRPVDPRWAVLDDLRLEDS